MCLELGEHTGRRGREVVVASYGPGRLMMLGELRVRIWTWTSVEFPRFGVCTCALWDTEDTTQPRVSCPL